MGIYNGHRPFLPVCFETVVTVIFTADLFTHHSIHNPDKSWLYLHKPTTTTITHHPIQGKLKNNAIIFGKFGVPNPVTGSHPFVA